MPLHFKAAFLIITLLVNSASGQSPINNREIRRYQVDAFTTDNPFSGNPAVVCPLDTWLPDSVMQSIAMENNLAATTFYVKEKGGYRIRWFTPTAEDDICGHGTLAAAFVLFNYGNEKGNSISFAYNGGTLIVSREQDLLTITFPVDTICKLTISPELANCFHEKVLEVYKGKLDYLFVLESEEQVRNCKPNFSRISKIGGRGSMITAKGNKADFVSRFFAPQYGVNEDQVTGSAHTSLTKYWSLKMNKNYFHATQLSKRGGNLVCQLDGAHVKISGNAKLFSIGTIVLD